MDFSINMRRVEAIRKGANQYLPGLDQARVIEIWGGLRPCTPDGLPIISRSDSFKNLFIAAGSWSPAIARTLRLNVPIQAAKGYSITLEKPAISPKIPLLFGEASVVVNPLGEALRVAGTLELAGMDFSINMRRVEAIRKGANQYLPGLDQARVIEIWRGLRPCTPDGLPIISRSDSFKNLFIAAGHAMLGMSLGPITGKLVSQLVNEEKTDVDILPFTIKRF
jgi:D-amino-acid dehydrogenase